MKMSTRGFEVPKDTYSGSSRHSAAPAALPIAVRAKRAPSNSSTDSASRSPSSSSYTLSECHSALQLSPPSPSQRPLPPTLRPTATLMANEAQPNAASPSSLSSMNYFPFVSTGLKGRSAVPGSQPSPAEVVTEATSAVALVADPQPCKTPLNLNLERELQSGTGTRPIAVQMPEGGHLVTRGRKITRVRQRATMGEQVY